MRRLVLAGAAVSVMTIFGESPKSAGIRNNIRVRMRHWENARACRAIGAACLNADFKAAVFRRSCYPKNTMIFDENAPLRETELVNDVIKWINDNISPDDIVYAPSAFGGHVDHRIVLAAARALPNHVILYEEFYHDWRREAEQRGFVKFYLSDKVLADKNRAVHKYHLEMPGLYKRSSKMKNYVTNFRTDAKGAFEKYSEKPEIPELIASITSYPERIKTAHRAIKSILNNTILPDRLVLYLTRSQFPGGESKLPARLRLVMARYRRLEIRWVDYDIKSYKKLVPALLDFPNDCIITFDDDMVYDRHLIARLLRQRRNNPESIIASRAKYLMFDDGGELMPYKKWQSFSLLNYLFRVGLVPRYRNMALSGSGTLFPPNSMHPDVVKTTKFTNMSPTTPDIWFWAMAVRVGTKTVVSGRRRRMKVILGTQKTAQWRQNVKGEMRNDTVMCNILNKYPDISRRLMSEIDDYFH